MKGVICRTEWPICLGPSLPGVPQGFPMVQGREGRLQMWGRQPWQPLALHRLGPARSWQEVCDGVAGNVLWLAEGLHFPAGTNLHRELEESPCVPPQDSSQSAALHLAVPSGSGALSCFHLDPALVLRSTGMAPEPAYGL